MLSCKLLSFVAACTVKSICTLYDVIEITNGKPFRNSVSYREQPNAIVNFGYEI
jgi:hypothetical protein